MIRAPNSLIDAIVAAPDDTALARLLHDGARELLIDPSAISDVAAIAVTTADDDAMQAAALLLSRALDEARMASENGAPEGSALIDTLEEALSAQDAAHALSPTLRLRLAQIYSRAGLPPPPFAMLTADVMANTDSGPAEVPGLDAWLDPVLEKAGDAPQEAHAALTELLAGLPPDLAAMLVTMTIARSGAVEARLGLYWLLDPQPILRLSAASALLSRAETGTQAADLGALLPTLRKWLPEDDARAALDGVIRRQMRSGISRTAPPIANIHRAAASLPDGVGAQSLLAVFQIGSRRGIAMAMLKQGHGVKDAFVIHCSSATEQKHMLARILDEVETFDISQDRLAEALAHGLGEGQELGLLPAPGKVDLAEILGPDTLSPVASSGEAILEAIGAAEALADLPAARRTALVKASADWTQRFDQADSWFEDTGALRAAIARAGTEKGRETAVWKHLVARRDWWARQFAVSAATLKSATEVDPTLWLSFAAVAQALLDGRSLKRIPIMTEIVDMTLDAADARDGDIAPVSQTSAPGEVGSLAAQAGITEAYLQGYLTALAIAPLEPSPQDWLGSLLGGIEVSDEGAINHLMGLVMIHANQFNDDAGDPKTVAATFDALNADDVTNWATGFNDFVTATRRCWPSKHLSAEDKRVLNDIDNAAQGAGGETLRRVLPSWVARRHALRQ